MAHIYYTAAASLLPGDLARAEDINARIAAISTGFDLLPTPRKDGTIGFTSTFTVPTPTAAGHPTTMNFVQTSMTSQVNQAATSATNAATSASGAATSATNASNSASAAATSATNSSNSATSASGSASTATTQASNASTSASNAATSASTATTQATKAQNYATFTTGSFVPGTTDYSAKHWADTAASTLASKADLASPTFTGTVTIPTLVVNAGASAASNLTYQGFNLQSSNTNSANACFGARYTGTQWIPASTGAVLISGANGLLSFYVDTGLTGGTAYTPVIRASLTSAGNLTATTFTGALAGNAATATVATNANNLAVTNDTATNATYYPSFAVASSGNAAHKVDTGLTYNPSTGSLTASAFVGALTGNASTATTATNANNVALTSDNATNSTHYLAFSALGTTGNGSLKTNSSRLGFNPLTGAMTVTGSIAASGTVTGNGGSLDAGSETVRGTWTEATTVEAAALTSATDVITARRLASAFNTTGQQSLAANGYQRLPGGLVLQWGTVNIAANTITTYTFPVAFASAAYSVTGSGASEVGNLSAQDNNPAISAISTTGFTLQNPGQAAANWWYIAVGV